ncbi:exopolysaccharide biosynthesis polyprenyl glycosylphosphotransferase [Candidatus Dependentiae bacterium]|nr:exopolysaccharide biosynthesis polyprenyl glycosylphosphotransferase [Candidatus Dependentiae bacterium]
MKRIISKRAYSKMLNLISRFLDLLMVLGIFVLVDLVNKIAISSSLFSLNFYRKLNPLLGYLNLIGVKVDYNALKALIIFAGFGLVQLVSFYLVKLYKKEISYLNFDELRRLIKGLLLGFILNLSLILAFNLEKLILNYFYFAYLVLIPALFLQKYFLYWMIKSNYLKGKWVKNVLIYDACPTGRTLMKKLFEAPQLGYKPIGFIDEKYKAGTLIDTKSDETKARIPVLGALKDFNDLINNYKIEQLFVATPAIKPGDLKRINHLTKKYGVPFKLIPNIIGESLYNISVDYVSGIPVMETKKSRLNFYNAILKRAFDVVIAVLTIIFFAPVYLLITLLIKSESKGPVIFKQKRIGLNGQAFVMYKFRSMKLNAPKYATTPKDGSDKRITKIGKFLRKTSLDELPQFFNVLKGNMSIVGPRPEMPFIVERYNNIQTQRLTVKPGITGIWQVTADRNRPIHENLDYDFYYINNQSILLDLVVIFRTVWFGVFGLKGV